MGMGRRLGFFQIRSALLSGSLRQPLGALPSGGMSSVVACCLPWWGG